MTIRQMLEERTGTIPEEQFKRIMDATTKDIKFNRLKFKKMTYIDDIIEIALIAIM